MKAKTIKVLQENISVNFHNIAIGIDFLEMIPKHKQNREKKIVIYQN